MVTVDEIVSQYLGWLVNVEKLCAKANCTTDTFDSYSFAEDFVIGRSPIESFGNAVEFWNATNKMTVV